jgi:hypothetical protein
MRTRRQWLQAAAIFPACFALLAARKDFWNSQDPAAWTNEEKQILLSDSPWTQAGFVRMETEKKLTGPGYGRNGRLGGDMPDTRPGVPPGGVQSVPIGGEKIPPPPKPDKNPLQFRVLARWESAKPVRLAGGPEVPVVPELTGQFYVIRLRGLPLMPPPKPKPGEVAADPNEGLLLAIKQGSRLERKDKPGIACTHLFTGSGDASTEVLLFFPRGADPITLRDKVVMLESRFNLFHLSIKFPLKEMMYKGELAL